MEQIKEELRQAMAECHRLTNQALAGKEVWKDLDNLYWFLVHLYNRADDLAEIVAETP